ncbi:hypothetical protein [Micromonospora okii]|uniref:hypothetical protein n=1 Tax=Micromonospora okii TaxID=1182970 RepID=UPI001E57A110|nr:hypothetical protein [Micromonospora okii]
MTSFRGMAAAALSGGAGAGVLAALWHEEVRFQRSCESDSFGACLSFALPVLFCGPVVLTAIVWLLLRATRVGRPLPAALLGAAASGGGALVTQAVRPFSGPMPVWLAVLLAVVGFAAGVAAMAASHPVVRAGLALTLLLPWAAAPALREPGRRYALRDGFAQVGLPLVVPQVEGYRVANARAFVERRVLSVRLERGEDSISVRVVPLPADFAPPARCGPAMADISVTDDDHGTPPPQPCRAAGHDHWVRAGQGEEVHLVRRGGAIVFLRSGPDTPSADAAAAAANLTEVTPERLAELAAR